MPTDIPLTFPRAPLLPQQSPKYWVKEKDRYLRQLLISDIQEITERSLIVYFTVHSKGAIEATDADDLSEALMGCKGKNIDLLIQTPGGSVDACEKIISLLSQVCNSYRVIVPSYSKSAGTVIALSSTEIVMGINSELGPIDPQFDGIPAEIISENHHDPVIKALCANAVQRMKNLAKKALKRNMLGGKTDQDIDTIVDNLSSAKSYLSHGAVIDADEARQMGLNIKFLKQEDDLWKRLWLLYCMYDFDCRRNNVGKIFEGEKYSISKLNS